MQRITPERSDKTKVYFLATCLVDLLCPEAGIDNIALFKREGVPCMTITPADRHWSVVGQEAAGSALIDAIWAGRAAARSLRDLLAERQPVK